MPICLTASAEICDKGTMLTAKRILEERFNGNLSAAARGTGISRASWSAWKNKGFPVPMPPKLAAWVLSSPAPTKVTPDSPTEPVGALPPA